VDAWIDRWMDACMQALIDRMKVDDREEEEETE